MQQNVDTIGRAWAAKEALVLIDYGCNADCVNMCKRRWTSMDECISGARNVCNCPSVIDIEYYEDAEATIGISPMGVSMDD